MRKLKLLSLLMLICFSVGTLWAADVTTTYVFQDRDWKAKIGDVDANWTVGTRAAGFTAGQGTQITTSADGANATSPTSFTNVSQIVIQYCTNSTKGAGTIKVQVGSGVEQSFAVTKPSSGGTTLKSTTFNFSPTESGSVKLTVNCTVNSVYIYSIAITETSDGGGGGKTTITDEQLAWSAANAEVTLGEEPYSFPSLTNTIPVSVSYQSTDETVASITDGGVISLLKAGSTTIKAIYSGDETYNAKTVSYALTVKPAPLTPIPGGVIDVLTSAAFSATSTTYTAFENKQATNLDHSDAVYIGKTARGGSSGSYYIQINSISSGNAGREIATTTSGGIVKRVEVDWGGSNTVDRYVMVYGSNEAYTGSETAKVGTELGKLIYTAGSTTEYIDIDGSYQYIQITANGAMYVNEIRITWVPSIKYAVNIIAPTGGTLVVKDGDDAITSGDTFVEGKTLTVEATPDGSHTGGTIMVKNGSDEDVTASVLSGTTLTVPAYAITVSASYAEKACTKLGTPSVTVTNKAYNGAKLTWAAVANADKYLVKFNGVDQEATSNLYFDATGLDAETQYTYQVKAIAEEGQNDWCDGEFSDEANFTTEEAPKAHLTLIDIEGNHASSGDYAILTPFALPSTAASCAKAFYGWTATENYSNASVAPEYKAGDEFTFANTTGVTLYAVYADELTPGAVSYVKTALADIASGSEVVVTEEKGANLWALSYNPSTSKTVAATVTETAGVLDVSGLTNGFWALTKDGDNFSLTVVGGTDKLYCNNSNDGVRVGSGAANTFSINNSYIYTSATTEARYLGVYNNTDFRCYTSINSNISGQTLAFYKKIVGEGTYGNYSTSCVAALADPEFTPAAGSYTEAKNIVITAEEGTVYYTLDGSDPTSASTEYTGAIVLDACGTTTVKAIAISTESHSAIVSAEYTINLPIDNSESTAYTPVEAKAIIDGDCDKSVQVFVKGVVTSATFNSGLTGSGASYNGTYNVFVKEEGSDGSVTFEFFRMWKDNTNAAFSDGDITVGDKLVAVGTLTKFNTTYEFAAGCYMVSREAYTAAKTHIANDIDHPYTVAQADGYIDDPITYDLDDEVFVRGVVTATTSTKITIRDTKEGTEYIELYKSTLADGITAPVVGDLIIGKGTMQKYNSTTYQMNQGCQVVWKKPAATMTFDALEMEVGDVEMMAPATITLAEASAVAYSIKAGSDACVTLDGAQITATAEGSAIIVATLIETSEYMGTTVEFAVTVTEADTRKIATGSAFTAIKGDLTPNDITFAAHKGEGTTEPIVKDENIRLYKPASGKSTGAYLTITALPGCKIDQVQITFSGNADAAYCKDAEAIPTAKYITSETELLTPAGLDAQSVSIVNLKNGSIDISAIKVWYTGEPLPLPEISYSPSIQSIQVGGAWSAPTLNNPNHVTIASYASDNEDVATVTDGGEIALKPDATGTAHITAHFDGNETYRAADAIYTIIVLSEADALLANSTWIRVDNAATLRAGMQVIVAQYGEGDVKAMGAQNSNNRAAVSATVSGNVLSPETGTQILTLVDAGEGKFAFLTTGGYLYAASSSSNYLKEEVEKDDKGNADWEISIAGGIATVIAQGTYTHNWMRYNSDNSLFSCYANGQADIALYVKADDYNRDVTAGRYGTICLPNGGLMEGATLYEVAYFDGAASKIFFDEIVNGAMEPGMPYIFLSNAPASKLGVIYSDEEPAVSAKNNNGLYGSFTQKLLAKNDGNYIMLNNQYLFVNSDEVYVGANRAYIRLEDVPTTATPLAPGRRRISMGVANEQVATGIDNLNADEAPMKMMIDGQLFILRGEKLYDATGRLVK